MSENEKLPAQTLINGGQEMAVRYKDGRSETVKVMLIPLSKIAAYLDSVGDINVLIELVCSKPPGWADTLDVDSAYAVDETARKVNDFLVERWLKRQAEAVTTMKATAQKVSELKNSLGMPSRVA